MYYKGVFCLGDFKMIAFLRKELVAQVDACAKLGGDIAVGSFS